MDIKMNFQTINDFQSSLRYRPWGILVGVSVSYPKMAVAQLLGDSGAYDWKVPRTGSSIHRIKKAVLFRDIAMKSLTSVNGQYYWNGKTG